MTRKTDEPKSVDAAGTEATPISREQLYELVWREPMLRVAERLGVSSSYMARVCTELRVPRPPRGYWAQLEFGKAPARPALPEGRAGDVTEWSPGKFIGAIERAAQKTARSQSPTSDAEPKPDAFVRPSSKQPGTCNGFHPLLLGIKPFFEKTRDSENGILRPFKRLLPDVLSSKEGLDAAINSANALFRALAARGHRLTIAPTSAQLRRADVDLRESQRKNHYQHPAWSPERPTVLYIGDVPIGLTLFEMTEAVEMLYVGNNSYVPVRSLTPNQRRKYQEPRYWTTTKDLPSGRLCLQMYSPSWLVNWVERCPEEKPGQFFSLVPAIVEKLEVAASELIVKLEAARIMAHERDRQWRDEQARRVEAEERERQERHRKDAIRELLAAIAEWDEALRIEAYFVGKRPVNPS